MSNEEITSSDILRAKSGTEIRLSQTGPNLRPVLIISDMVPEPDREAVEAVLLVHTVRDPVGAIRPGHNEGEDEDNEEEADEECHTAEVECKERLLVQVGTEKAKQGDDEERKAQDDDGPSEHVDTLVVRLRGEP